MGEQQQELTVGIVGAGTMGTTIAAAALIAGSEVVVFDSSCAVVSESRARIRKLIDRELEAGRVAETSAASINERFETATSLAELARVDIVIEAIVESVDSKQYLFSELSTIVPETCVLATNTSSLSVTQIAHHVPHNERVIGLHFFNPAHRMPVVELVGHERSSEAALAQAKELVRRMGKTVLRASDSPGFIINRCNRPYSLEALRLVESEIATIEQVDQICRDAQFPLGPFELMDLIGIDVAYSVTESLFEQSGQIARWKPSELARAQRDSGKLGRKSGEGWYRYSEGKAIPSVTKEPPRAVRQQVLDRIVSQLINEAHFAHDEQVATKADIDLGMRLGVFHPRGPFEWEQLLGTAHVVSVLVALQQLHAERYELATSLREAVVRT